MHVFHANITFTLYGTDICISPLTCAIIDVSINK